MKKLLIIGCICIAFFACSKEENPMNPIPKLELVSIGPQVVKEFMDSVQIVIAYEDGDGDLGGVHPDSSNLFVIDKRINVPFEFRIQELVPQGEAVPIKGRFNIILQNLFLTGSGSEEDVSFDIYALDRAGHRSNIITTNPIKVLQ